jgi:TRAP-type C4-dicarboxylate transport system permease small subunit
MYEHRKQQLLPRRKFAWRVLLHLCVALLFVLCALALGIAGYHYIAGLPWIDALLNAAMILGGMGPVDPLTTIAAKAFASAYALFAGLLFIGILGIVVLPFAHRLMHKLHMEDSEGA